jgi:hypothetical protein
MSIVKKINNIDLKNFYSSGSTSGTIGTGQTKACVVFIPANTFKAKDVIHLSTVAGNSSTTQQWDMYFYWNTANTLTSAIEISRTVNIPVGSEYCQFSRFFYLESSDGSGDGTLGLNSNASGIRTAYQNVSLSVTVTSNYSLDWTVDSYIMVALSADANQTIRNAWLKVSTF